MKTLNWKFFLLLPALALVFTACENAGTSEEEAPQASETEETQPEAGKYTLTPFSPSASFADASIDAVKFENGKFDFTIGGDTYELGVQTPDAPQKMCANSGKGQHIHLIIDREPYAAKYEAQFDYEIPDGEHYMLAFLSRSYHESIKTDAAHTAQKVMVKDNGFESTEPIEEPVLFYSRPKGTYIGKAETDKVMLDFYLVNAMLGDEYMVQVEVNGEQIFTVDAWQPYYLEGLPMGDNKIKLTLVDAKGNAVDTPLNPVERVFTLKEDPAENAQ
jgi:hypothetical protein